MNFAEFKKIQIINHYSENLSKANQFGVVSTADKSICINPKIEKLFTSTDVFGITNVDQFNISNDFAVILGIKPTKLHLGHLNIIKEVQYWQSLGGYVFIVLGYYEKLIDLALDKTEAEKVTSEIKSQLENAVGKSISIVDTIHPEWSTWLQIVEKETTVNKINQLLGWDKSKNILSYHVATNMATSFLVPQFYFKKPITTIIPCGVTELPFIELSKIVARKIGFNLPIVSLKMKIPSVDESSRMSSNSPNSSIFLTDNVEEIKQKLIHSKTGGRQSKEEQLKDGGDILNCSFFKISSFFIDEEICDAIISDCKAGKLCSSCKSDTLKKINRNLLDLINTPLKK